MNAPHDMMIYGYDDDKQIVYAADFFNQKYTFNCILLYSWFLHINKHNTLH